MNENKRLVFHISDKDMIIPKDKNLFKWLHGNIITNKFHRSYEDFALIFNAEGHYNILSKDIFLSLNNQIPKENHIRFKKEVKFKELLNYKFNIFNNNMFCFINDEIKKGNDIFNKPIKTSCEKNCKCKDEVKTSSETDLDYRIDIKIESQLDRNKNETELYSDNKKVLKSSERLIVENIDLKTKIDNLIDEIKSLKNENKILKEKITTIKNIIDDTDLERFTRFLHDLWSLNENNFLL